MLPEVRSNFGFALYQAQIGKYPDIGKTLRGFGGANVVELKLDAEGDTFRAVYTVQFKDAVFYMSLKRRAKKDLKLQNKIWN